MHSGKALPAQHEPPAPVRSPDPAAALAGRIANASLARSAAPVRCGAQPVLRAPLPAGVLARRETPPSTSSAQLGISKFKFEIEVKKFPLGSSPFKATAKVVVEVTPLRVEGIDKGGQPAQGAAGNAVPAGGETTVKVGKLASAKGSEKGGIGLEGEIKHKFGSGEWLSAAFKEAKLGVEVGTSGAKLAVNATPKLPTFNKDWKWGSLEIKPLSIDINIAKIDKYASKPEDVLKIATAAINIGEITGSGKFPVGDKTVVLEAKVKPTLEIGPDWPKVPAWLVTHAGPRLAAVGGPIAATAVGTLGVVWAASYGARQGEELSGRVNHAVDQAGEYVAAYVAVIQGKEVSASGIGAQLGAQQGRAKLAEVSADVPAALIFEHFKDKNLVAEIWPQARGKLTELAIEAHKRDNPVESALTGGKGYGSGGLDTLKTNLETRLNAFERGGLLDIGPDPTPKGDPGPRPTVSLDQLGPTVTSIDQLAGPRRAPAVARLARKEAARKRTAAEILQLKADVVAAIAKNESGGRKPVESGLRTSAGKAASYANATQMVPSHLISVLKKLGAKGEAFSKLSSKDLKTAEGVSYQVSKIWSKVISSDASVKPEAFARDNAKALEAARLYEPDDMQRMFAFRDFKRAVQQVMTGGYQKHVAEFEKLPVAKLKKLTGQMGTKSLVHVKAQAAKANKRKKAGEAKVVVDDKAELVRYAAQKKALGELAKQDVAKRLGMRESDMVAYTKYERADSWNEDKAGWQRKALSRPPKKGGQSDRLEERLNAAATAGNGHALSRVEFYGFVDEYLRAHPEATDEQVCRAAAHKNQPGDPAYPGIVAGHFRKLRASGGAKPAAASLSAPAASPGAAAPPQREAPGASPPSAAAAPTAPAPAGPAPAGPAPADDVPLGPWPAPVPVPDAPAPVPVGSELA